MSVSRHDDDGVLMSGTTIEKLYYSASAAQQPRFYENMWTGRRQAVPKSSSGRAEIPVIEQRVLERVPLERILFSDANNFRKGLL